MKSLVEQQGAQILPYLVQGAIYQETLNIEIIRPTMRADRVYRVIYHQQPHILHLEFQTGKDANLPARLLVYCSVLYQDCKLPIISVIVYPFRTIIAKPPLSVMSGNEEIIKLNYRILLLFEEDATTYVESYAISMYPLLPAMKRVTAPLIQQVAEEMKSYYREQQKVLNDQFVWMQVFLDGTNTITPEEKRNIEEVLRMLGMEQIWDENPRVQQTFARGEARGKIEGQLQEARASVLTVIKLRFPALLEQAQQQTFSLIQPEALHVLHEQLIMAPNEEAARRLLLPQQPS